MFTTQARALTTPYWEGSFTHPFITGLKDGLLFDEKFRYYLIQDRYYLEHFSKLHYLIAEKTDDLEVKEMLLEGAAHLAEGEIAIRETFFEELGITQEEIDNTEIAPTAYHYVSHMYRQLLDGSVKSAVAGLLPCAWLYQEIGVELIKEGSPKDLYQRWIETYAGEEAASEVAHQCDIVNRLFESATKEEQVQMSHAFVTSARMEHAFWEMSETLEVWPKGDTEVVVNVG